MKTSLFGTYRTQLNESGVRVEEFDGDPHVVAPVVAVQESVLKGMYLPAEEVSAASPAFNGQPLPVGHPMEGGEFVSANTPNLVENQSVGSFFNVETSDDGGSMQGETWVNAPKSARLANERDPLLGAPLAILAEHLDDPSGVGEYLDALPEASRDLATQTGESGMLEVSTAYWFDPEETPGSFEGNAYAAIQRHVRPDHLALLPHKEGECSVADGCGAPRGNEHGYDSTTAAAHERDTEAHSPADQPTANPLSAAASAIGRFAHNCVCDCGGDCYDDSMNTQELADQTGISLEVLEEMDEGDRKALADLASQSDDDTAGADGTTDDDNSSTDTTDGSAPTGEVEDALGELRSELEATREELADVKEVATAQQQAQKQDLIDAIEPNSSLDRESLADLTTEVLEGMHADLTPARADMGGRVRGVPAGNTSGETEERVQEATELAAQLKGTAGGNAGDD